MALSITQQLILDKAKEGHSLLILGHSGTGKSHLVKEIARELLRYRKFVSTVRIETFFLKTLNYFRIKVLQVPQILLFLAIFVIYFSHAVYVFL